jgi:glycopeptide antibiotics resistance protein
MSILLLFRPMDTTTGWNVIPVIHTIAFASELSTGNFIWYFGGNTLLFVPMGYFFQMMTHSWQQSFFFGLGLMIGVEVLQAVTARGVCDIDDLLLNMIGITAGIFLRIGHFSVGKHQ